MVAFGDALDAAPTQTTGSLGNYWIGLSLDTTTSQYKWADGSTIGNGKTLLSSLSAADRLLVAAILPCTMLQCQG
jgi:hypothetical protein